MHYVAGQFNLHTSAGKIRCILDDIYDKILPISP